jgi:hypothetical protein
VANVDEALKCTGFGRFAMNDSQTYPQKMCITKNHPTSQEVTLILQKLGKQDVPSKAGDLPATIHWLLAPPAFMIEERVNEKGA